MKKFLCIFLLIPTILLTFAACDGASSENLSENENTELDESGDYPYWNGFDFGPNIEYNEEYEYTADPGEYLNPAEAAKLTFDTMRDNGNIPDYSDDTEYTMVLAEMLEIEGEECYVYRLDWDSQTVGAAYAYAYQSGNIYMQGQMGMWVIPVKST